MSLIGAEARNKKVAAFKAGASDRLSGFRTTRGIDDGVSFRRDLADKVNGRASTHRNENDPSCAVSVV